jgi:hypothetical protein
MECRMKDEFVRDRGLPMLDALLEGRKLWDISKEKDSQKRSIGRLRSSMRDELDYMLDREPTDEFHANILLGALNLVSGLLDDDDEV